MAALSLLNAALHTDELYGHWFQHVKACSKELAAMLKQIFQGKMQSKTLKTMIVALCPVT